MTDKHFGLAGVGQRRLEGNRAAGRAWEAACVQSSPQLIRLVSKLLEHIFKVTAVS
jgi:hypothetical protein